MDAVDHFRMFFWQKFAPLFALPVFAVILWFSPITSGWNETGWAIAGSAVGFAVAAYLLDAWFKSDAQLDDVGLTLHAGGRRETWRYEKLLQVKQAGRHRVRMCFDPDIPDTHAHVTVDLFDSNGFIDALLDRYAGSQGHSLPELPSRDEGAGGDSDADSAAA